ncbi:MAG: hypothetical protein HY897_15360 [Deltaproteobacteria bacterium]|nr:hypothetical protein [Deltaproteobacteria bacterium]
MNARRMWLVAVGVFLFVAPPPDVLAGTIEDELAALDQKIQSGGANPADVKRYNDLLQMLQDQERKKPKNNFLKPRFRLNGHGQFQQGFGMTMITPPAQSDACGEFKNIYYNCADLPWNATDGWTRTDETGDISVRPCARDDACVSDGVLGVNSNDGVLLWRIENGLLTERYASATFRMKQTLSERNPHPDSDVIGGGVVWIDDGVKSTAVGLVEDLNGDKLVLMPIEGHPDPETGELNITEVLTVYHDWSAWHDYRLVRDAEGTVELLADGDPTPVVSYPYASLNMGSLGGPAVLFGNLIEGQVARVLFELDYLNYSVGMPHTEGCSSAGGNVQVLHVINDNRLFDPAFEPNRITSLLRVKPIGGLASNTQSHRFYLRAERVIRDLNGTVIRMVRDDALIGPIGTGRNPAYLESSAVSLWDGMNSAGQLAQPGTYSYTLSWSVVSTNKQGIENTVLSGPVVTGATGISPSVFFPRVIANATLSSFHVSYASVQANQQATFSLKNCSIGSDPILDVFYDFNQQTGRYGKSGTSDDHTFPTECQLVDSKFKCSRPVGSYFSFRSAKTENVMVVARAKADDKAGLCDLTTKIGTATSTSKIYFGGKRIAWYVLNNDEVQNAPLTDHDTLMIFAEPTTFVVRDSATAPQYDDDGGVGKASLLRSNREGNLLTYIGTKLFWGGVSNVYRNDAPIAGHDTDGDGLGDRLEIALGTCPTDSGTNKYGFNCALALEGGKDTDGDGLRDYWEVLGVRYAPGETKNEDLALTLMGANPLHKDVFIEADYWTGSDNHYVRAEVIDGVKNFYGSGPISNPDGVDGISVSILNGQSTGCDHDICVDSPAPIRALCPHPDPDRECRCAGGVLPCDINRTHIKPFYFTANRVGVFHWFIMYHGPGGNGDLGGPTASVGTCFDASCGTDEYNNFIQFATTIHELGHNLGLDHGGGDDYNNKPNYPSLMNYDYEFSFDGSPMTISGTKIRFSTGSFRDVPVPSGLDENHLCEWYGLGTNNVSRIHYLFSRFPHCVDDAHPTTIGISWNGNDYCSDSCIFTGIGSVVANINGDVDENDDPIYSKLNDWNDWTIIEKDVGKGFHDDQCSRFKGDFCGRSLTAIRTIRCDR